MSDTSSQEAEQKGGKQHERSARGARRGAGPLALIGAAVAGAAMGYFFLGTQAKRRRKELKGWALKARADVLEKLETLQEVTRDTYEETVDTVVDRYGKTKKVTEEEAEQLKRELKRHWGKIAKEVGAGASATKKAVTKNAAAGKRAARKSPTRSSTKSRNE